MFKTDCRYFGKPELLRGPQAAVPGNYLQVGIDQQGDIETESTDTFGNLPDLLF